MKYGWILKQRELHNVAMLCSMLSVSRNVYYAWIKAIESQRIKDDAVLKTVITTTFTQNRTVYGTRRLKAVLSTQDYSVSRRRIARLMKETGLYCKTKRRFTATTDSKHELSIAPNQFGTSV
mgnify:CR=1 FL=1